MPLSPQTRKTFDVFSRGMRIVRDHAHPKHHKPIDSYFAFARWLVDQLERLEIKVTQYGQAATRAEAEKNAWKAYAQAQKTKADQADRARQALQDQIDNLPPQPDAEDLAIATGVIAAPDDLPPTEPAPLDLTGGAGGVP